MASTDPTPPSRAAAQMLRRMPNLKERTNQVLLEIIRDNFNTQYATQATSLAEFRAVVSAHGGAGMDAAQLLADFRKHVPLSDYDSYKPYIEKFNAQPCKEEDVVNLLSPGMPLFFLGSSATSGTRQKVVPKYDHRARYKTIIPQLFDLNNKDPLAAMTCTGCRDIRVIERGQVSQSIPVYCGTGGFLRMILGWYTDDESWMSLAVSGYAVPLAATTIVSASSFLAIHALFFLAHRNVYQFRTAIATQFIDLIRYIDEHWDLLVSCIRDGVLPYLEGIDHARRYIQAHFHANPERATELREIGPPFSSDGWFSRVWPNAASLSTICSGAFVTTVPKVKAILGPKASLLASGYSSSEGGIMGFAYDASKLNEFALLCEEVIEFLECSSDADHEHLFQPWELEIGKCYEPILTTRDGLWRYRMGDVLRIVGFHTESNTPLFKYIGRTSLVIRLPTTHITDDRLLAAVQAVSSEDGVDIIEFTTVLDCRTLEHTLGFFIELAGPLGSDAHLTKQKIHDVLTRDNSKDPLSLQWASIPLPTIRIVKSGTFAAYREWKCENSNIPPTQIKVPAVLLDPTALEWIAERVVREL